MSDDTTRVLADISHLQKVMDLIQSSEIRILIQKEIDRLKKAISDWKHSNYSSYSDMIYQKMLDCSHC